MRYLRIAALAIVMVMTGCAGLQDMKYTELDPNPITLPTGQIFIDSKVNVDYGKEFYKATQEIKDYHIIISSFGGAAFDCISIIERIAYLQSKGCKITTEVYGWAMSAGTYILLAGDTRIVGTNSVLMLHSARSGGGYNNKPQRNKDLEKKFMKPYHYIDDDVEYQEDKVNPPWHYHQMLTMIDDVFTDLLKRNTNLTDKEINHWLYFEDSNFLDAQEAWEIGLATKIR